MKNLFKRIAFITLAVLSCALHTGCNKEGKGGEYSVSMKLVGPDYVDLYFTGPGSFEVAYVISEEDEPQVNPAIMFMSGDKITVAANSIERLDRYDTKSSAKYIKQNTTYYMYICAKLGTQYSAIDKFEFTTSKYDFDEVLTVVGKYYNGYKMHVTVPQSVKDAGNALRYAMTNKFSYNMATKMLGDTEFDMLIFNGGPDTRFIKNDSTFVITDDTIYEYDKEGNPVLDDSGNKHIFHMPVSPGEPSVFLVGEFRYGHMDENPQGVSWGSEKYDRGYVVPLLDWDTDEWTGVLEKIEFKTKEPEVLNANLDITFDVSVTDAHVYFKPDKNIHLYIPLILDVETYNQIVSFLDGDESLVQWYLTSYQATSDFIISYYQDAVDFDATEAFSTPSLKGGTDYYIIATAMGDESGTSQAFFKKEFKTRPYTLQRPILQVTPLPVRPDGDNSTNVFTSPFEAAYNIKLINKDVAGELKGGCYACNYVRQWQYMFNQKQDYESVLATNFNGGYATFSKEELKAINSEEGLDIVIPTLDGEISRLAVYGHNAEYLFNRVNDDADGNHSPAVADVETPYANALPRVDSDLFSSLPGEWVATATLSAYEKDDEGNYQKYNHIHKAKVTISSTAPEIPALTQDVIDLYVNNAIKKIDSTKVDEIAKKKAETEVEVRDMYDELHALAERFTEARLTNQNCLLCTGFMDFDYGKVTGRLDTRTPWGLFTDVEYNAVDVAQLYYDFGPKWFLQVQPDGSLAVPFNTALLPPLHEWGGYPNYIGGYDMESNDGFITSYNSKGQIITGYFPVTVNADRTKITVHPIQRPKIGDDGLPVVENGDTVMVNYYMNAIGMPSSTEIVAPLVSELVLEKKPFSSCPTCDEIYPAADAKANKVMVYDYAGNPVAPKKAAAYRSMTKFLEPVKYKKAEIPVITIDKFNEVMEAKYAKIRESLNMNR